MILNVFGQHEWLNKTWELSQSSVVLGCFVFDFIVMVVMGSFGGISPCLDRRQIPRQQSAAFSQPRSPPQTDRYLYIIILDHIEKSRQLTMLIVVDAALEDGEKTSYESLILTQSLGGA